MKAGEVYDSDLTDEYTVRYKVLSVGAENVEVEILHSANGLWEIGEHDTFAIHLCKGDILNKEYKIKQLLQKLDEQEQKETDC